MRIAVVNNFFPPRAGGSSHLSESLARGYAAAGHEVLVLTAAYQDAPAVEERDGLRIVRLPAFMLPQTRLAVSFDISFTTRPSVLRRVRRLLDDFRPDVIHQHGQFFDLTWVTSLYARKRGVPVLLSVHTRLENPAARYAKVFRGLDATMVKPFMWRSRPRVVVMDVLMQEYIESRYRGAYAGLAPIPVGVDPDWVLGGNGQRVRDRHDLGASPVILSVGHVIPLRDRVALVEALPEVLAAVPDAKLLICGQVYYDVFAQRARALGVEHAVIAAGKVAKSEIPDYLAAATVESHEQGIGLGTATLEAMAAGVPVVAPARPDNFPGVELVDGENVLLCPPGDGHGLAARLVRALTDPALAKQVGVNGQALIRAHFSLERVLQRHLAVLTEMAAARVR
ncbi:MULTISPECIES: glycosyltransferase family 4 protein [Micromonospora]|uniref:Glycosyltransferase involved in cell wall bisynthesis n=1 Tax=Micromonospora yangpuensis TaxID=683228 RepID=A0A1C6UG19_9ACTN|nr:glycosyltransferase family 4 protein [Micromonospora yangpuensis]GGM05036.1 glucosyltransferase [Micromonospora yangpuensis]SCL53055.1 Glycosyltransferase involved in cell wall bisynthesis [Micromonospora yangpuensis]